MGDCEALPTGDRSPLGSFHVPFPFGKRLTVNVFRQRINQLFQCGRDIWRRIAQHSGRAIAKHSLREITFSVPPDSFSRENSERVEGRLRSTRTSECALCRITISVVALASHQFYLTYNLITALYLSSQRRIG